MPLSWNDIRNNAVEFVREWADETSEDAEAKSFWDAFFKIFGVPRRRIATFEKNVTKAGGNKGYIDLFWPGVLIAEHKSRGRDLDRAFDQALDYFPGLTDKELPRYVVVSDFARFRVTDLESGDETEFTLAELPDRVSDFGFIAGYEARTYKEQDPVNIEAAEHIARLHDALKAVGYEAHELEVYLVRIMFCLFADDTGIFMPRGAFEHFVRERTAEDGSDLASRLDHLFSVLNQPPEKRLKNLDEQLAAFPYVNGRLFEERLSFASFDRVMRDKLLQCCDVDWGKISPAIFGSLFQGIMDAEMRRNLGAHYTSEKNILKLIGPLFLDELRGEFERIKNDHRKLMAFHEKLASMNFFDPACGCGNFLVISYRELRLLELDVIKQLYGKTAKSLALDATQHYVKMDVHQFHGIEIEEWPAQIAQVAMWLIDHQMNLKVGEAFGQAFVRIPLTKSANIVHANALRMDWNDVVPADRCDYLFGNPPFLGKKEQSHEQKADFAATIKSVPRGKTLDFVAAWYIKAAEYINAKTECAFVSTNSITQGEQVGALWSWLLSKRISIRFAHRTFRWKNEARGVAAVHCVIIGFGLSASKNKIIYDYADVGAEAQAIPANRISPYLVDADDILLNNRRAPISPEAPTMSYGSFALDDGNYTLDEENRSALIAASQDVQALMRPFIGGKELINGHKRWCLWLKDVPPSEIRRLPPVRQRVEAVRLWRSASDRATTRSLAATPSLFAEIRQPEKDYLALPTVSSERRRYIPMAMLSPDVIASNQVYVLEGATSFHFGVLTSEMHMAWVRSVCGRMKSDFRYSAGIVYNNFPWPTEATEAHRKKIEAAAQDVLDARASHPGSTLADLYDPNTMPPNLVRAHKALDRAVDAAYVPSGGKRAWASEADRVAFLFGLYQRLTSLLPSPAKKAAKRARSERATVLI